MDKFQHSVRSIFFLPLIGLLLFAAGCGTAPTVNTNVNANTALNTNINTNSNANSNANLALTVPEAQEPNQYRATVTMRIEATGDQKRAALPTLSAQVARSGDDRQMVFTMPAGGRVIFLDKAGQNYLVLPERNQYAELDQESLGFQVRRLLMPEQIVEQVASVQGVERVGEEQMNGRTVVKYRYAAVANTQSQAGQVATESFLIVDKETGLPLRSETVSQSQSGGNVQGFQGVRIITEITEIQTEVSPDLFALPTNMQKIESNQVRAQVDALFNTVAGMLMQFMNQQGSGPAPSPMASPTMSPAANAAASPAN